MAHLKCPRCPKTYKTQRGYDAHLATYPDHAEPAEADSERPNARPPVETAPPERRLPWALNGPTWQADSLKVPGRVYTVRHTPDKGWLAGYTGQKSTCPAAGQPHGLASQARRACQEIEDAIEA